ncbi:hypothetical protein [Paraburkholderia guartelaensis]|uniref:hypothetical protein n=1 Tax=Paraburkholderia guartelaensis TaxID=2546446 RepID=UPI002AB66614|nr:hypothetical protein [Paraburkholderia guartelaensis]
MTFEEALPCQRGEDLVYAECGCSLERPAHARHGDRCTPKHTNAESLDAKETKEAAVGVHCRCWVTGCIDQRDSWIASYVRTRLRTMVADAFPISRHTTDVAARALQDRFLSDTDAVLKRILDLAALRYLRDGSSTVTLEDVTVALRSVEFPQR